MRARATQLWRYTRSAEQGLPHRPAGREYLQGLALLHVFGRAPALARSEEWQGALGMLKWPTPSKGQWATMAPLIVGDHVLVGASGDFDNLQGFIRSIDAETGKTQWQWDATPPVGTSPRRPRAEGAWNDRYL